MIEAILIPFKGKIIFAGGFRPYPISFGEGFKKGLNADFEKSKSKFGIISSFDQPIQENEQSEEELLRFYLKNKYNREEFWNEINKILEKNPNLNNVYHNEIGKSYVRETKKILSEIGAKSGWFAIVNSQIAASGKTKGEVTERIKDILPEDKLSSAHIFEYGNKKQAEK